MLIDKIRPGRMTLWVLLLVFSVLYPPFALLAVVWMGVVFVRWRIRKDAAKHEARYNGPTTQEVRWYEDIERAKRLR